MSNFLLKSDNKSKRKNKNKKNYNKKIYNSNMADSIKNIERIQAKQLKETGFSSQFDTLLLDRSQGNPVGINQSNIIKRDNSVSYDTSLQRDIDYVNGYSEFGPTQMHYNAVPEFEMMSSNMHPHTTKREYTINQNYSHQLALNTGIDPFYKSKTEGFEPVTLFEPSKDLTYVHGAPSQTHLLEERYLPSTKNNNGDLPFNNNLKVQPGIFGENLPPNTVYRNLPKSTNELRSKTNQKITYKADKIEAVKKGEKRSILSNPTKYKKKSYRERNMDDYLPNASVVSKRKMEGKYKKPTTHRSISKSVMGSAYRPEKGKKYIGKYTETGKQSFASDAISRATTNADYNPVLQNKKAYRNVENERSSTNHNIPGAAQKPTRGGYTMNPKDIPLTTLRQLMIEGDTNIGVTGRKNNMYVFSKDNVLPENNRTTTTTNNTEGNVTSRNKEGYIYNKDDKPNTTIRELTTNNTHVSSLQPTNKGTYYFDDKDKLKSTIRETTENYQREGFINTGVKDGYYFDKHDVAKDTIKQTTQFSTRQGTLTGEQTGYYFDKNDVTKQTIRETTELLNRQGAINIENKKGHYFNKKDKPNMTIRDTTGFNNRTANQTNTDGGSYLQNKDKARQTIKESTIYSSYNTGIADSNKGNYVINPDDTAKTTIKEMTLEPDREANVRSNQQSYAMDYNDMAKPTIRYSTLHSTRGGRVGTENGGAYVKDYDDIAKSTIKESTLHSTQGGRAGTENGGMYTKDYKDKAKPTIRQSTLHSTQGGRAGTENGGAYIKDYKDKAKPTIRQSTLHSTQGGRIGRENGESSYYRDKNDKAKKTIKETTLHSTQSGRLGREHGDISYYRDKKDKARCTIKQTTLLQNHIGPLGASIEKHTTQEAEQNMTVDERRETLTYSRPAGPKSDRAGPIMNKNTVNLKEENFIKRKNYGYDRTKCNQGQLTKVFTRNKELLNNPNYRINDDFIKTLHSNPLVNDLMHQKR